MSPICGSNSPTVFGLVIMNTAASIVELGPEVGQVDQAPARRS